MPELTITESNYTQYGFTSLEQFRADAKWASYMCGRSSIVRGFEVKRVTAPTPQAPQWVVHCVPANWSV